MKKKTGHPAAIFPAVAFNTKPLVTATDEKQKFQPFRRGKAHLQRTALLVTTTDGGELGEMKGAAVQKMTARNLTHTRLKSKQSWVVEELVNKTSNKTFQNSDQESSYREISHPVGS